MQQTARQRIQKIVVAITAELACAAIPLTGKRPAASIKRWRQFIQHLPTARDYDRWFKREQHSAYGILPRNGLFILDFDNQDVYEIFRASFPDAAKTLTVQTRRGVHVYLRTNTDMPSAKFAGGDILSTGRYAVGPGSIIRTDDGAVFLYKRTQQQPVRNIPVEIAQSIVQTLNPAKETRQDTKQAPKHQAKHALEVHYKTRAPQIGRNNALYEAARSACEQGINQNKTRSELVNLHSTMPASVAHRQETRRQRRQEALRTIASAYKRRTQHKKRQQTGLPNNLREYLLKCNGGRTNAGRLYEAILREGIQPGRHITLKLAEEIGKKYRISERHIREVLRGSEGQITPEKRLFPIGIPPQMWEWDKRDVNRNNSSKNRTSRGRRLQFFFLVPSPEALCEQLSLPVQSWDKLSTEDLSSAAAYRRALHREFIARNQPEQSMAWYAQRLQVSTRTIRRYNHTLNVQKTPIYGYFPLTWHNVDTPDYYSPIEKSLSGRQRTPGRWLQRADGRRFPAIKGIALRELAAGAALIACRQLPSRLRLPSAVVADAPGTVIWRCLDASYTAEIADWQGDKHAFPPWATQKSSQKRQKTGTAQGCRHHAGPTPQGGRPGAEVQAKTAKNDEKRSSRSRTPVHEGLFSAYLLQNRLTLIHGIGPQRAAHLYEYGIDTLPKLVAAGPERLARLGWDGGYVTLQTTRRWVTEAEVLLGWRQPDAEAEARQAEYRARAETLRRYRNHVQRYLSYLERVQRWENDLLGTANDPEMPWNAEVIWFRRYVGQLAEDRSAALHPLQVQEVYQRIRTFTTEYQERIAQFLAMDDRMLWRYVLGDRPSWKQLERQTQKQTERFRVNIVWPERENRQGQVSQLI